MSFYTTEQYQNIMECNTSLSHHQAAGIWSIKYISTMLLQWIIFFLIPVWNNIAKHLWSGHFSFCVIQLKSVWSVYELVGFPHRSFGGWFWPMTGGWFCQAHWSAQSFYYPLQVERGFIFLAMEIGSETNARLVKAIKVFPMLVDGIVFLPYSASFFFFFSQLQIHLEVQGLC